MPKPVLLDLFAGAGGAAMGYHRAGFDVIGVDHHPQPHYPFSFVQFDALAYLTLPLWWSAADAIHASPPCPRYSKMTNCNPNGAARHPDMIADTRAALEATGLPWVIENVPGAPMRPDYKLCGCMFGLERLQRPRWFETSWHGFDLRQPCSHGYRGAIAVAGHGRHGREYKSGLDFTQTDRNNAMGIQWMNRDELAQAIPPAYTEWIGARLLDVIRAAA